MDSLPIAVRAYLDVPTRAGACPDRPAWTRVADPGPSKWSLVFDTETTTDAAQQLRFGTYQIREGDRLDEAGFFYDPETLAPSELALLKHYAHDTGQQCMPVVDFIEQKLYGVGYELGATIVGFNLPFDLARLAIRHASARGKAMRGGFSFKLSPDKTHPPVQVKHLSRRAALIRFAATRRQCTPHGQRRRGLWVPARRGYFVDVKTLAAALTARTFSLGSLAKFLGLSEGKLTTDQHGGLLTEDYLRYAVRDAEVTWQCYRKLRTRYLQHGLTGTPVHRVLSEAGLGKAYLKEMGIRPWREVQPDVPPELTGQIMSSYYGGRSEVRIRRQVTEVAYCDFLSMYPTVCTLMGLWQFVIADSMQWHDATANVKNLLEAVTLDQLQTAEFWKRLPVLVQIAPDDDLLPIRACYGSDPQHTIGLNHLTSPSPLWFTLADCIASKLLTGKTPRILQALRFEPGPVQPNLRPIAIAGNRAYRIAPTSDDFYRRLIDLRQQTRHRMQGAEGAARDRLDAEQLGLKILANATSYGIFAEINVDESPQKDVACYGPDGEACRARVSKMETPGRYFHPLLAALITGAARLMLATAERLAADAGIGWVLCDTDSLAIAKPDAMPRNEFDATVAAILAWYVPLNPYTEKGSLLKMEPPNFAIGKPRQREPLFAFAVSAKRYALFNLDAIGRPILRKASAHGLGHLIAPYREADVAGRDIPSPQVDLTEIGVDRWEHDLWYRIVCAALDGHPEHVETRNLPNFDQPAVSRYAATTPELLRWFKHYNRRKPYRQQVRPFGFLLAYQGRSMTEFRLTERQRVVPTHSHKSTAHRARMTTTRVDAPQAVAPFDRNSAKAAKRCFDRNSGQPVPVSRLKSYGQALLRYHLHPETKFEGGRFTDRGLTRPRHIEATAVELIGKEANRWEEQFYLGADPEAQNEFGIAPRDRERMLATVRNAAKLHGIEVLANRAKLSRQHVHDVVAGRKRASDSALIALTRASGSLTPVQPSVEELLTAVRERCRKLGCRGFARLAGVNDSNLGRILAGSRRPSAATVSRLARALQHISKTETVHAESKDRLADHH